MLQKISRRRKQTMLLLSCVLGCAFVGLGIAIFILSAQTKKLRSLELVPVFYDTELNVNSDYVFMVNTVPEDYEVGTLQCNANNDSVIFTQRDSNKVLLHTTHIGKVDISVATDEIVSNFLSYRILDKKAAGSEEPESRENPETESANAEEEASLNPEEETTSPPEVSIEPAYTDNTITETETEGRVYIKTTENIKVRSTPDNSSDSNVVDAVIKGTKYRKLGETNNGWTKVQLEIEGNKSGYIRSTYTTEITSEEYYNEASPENLEGETEAQPDPQAGQPETLPTGVPAETPEAPAEALMEEPMLSQTQGHQFTDKNGQTAIFTDDEWAKLRSVWAYTGQEDALIAQHTVGELKQILNTM